MKLYAVIPLFSRRIIAFLTQVPGNLCVSGTRALCEDNGAGVQDSMNQQRLIQFDRLVRTYSRKVFLVLDNLKVHHGKKVAAWLDRHRDKIELFFLPPYAPESNPDEYLNHALKLSVHSGDLPRTKYDIRHKTASFIRTLQHSPDKVSTFFHHNQISYILGHRSVDPLGNIGYIEMEINPVDILFRDNQRGMAAFSYMSRKQIERRRL